MATGPEIRGSLMLVAEKAKTFAQSISPKKTGDLVSSYGLVEASLFIGRAWRAMVMLQNTSPHFAAANWGNDRNGHTAHQIFKRTLEYLKGAG